MSLRRVLLVLGIGAAMVSGTALAASAISGGQSDGSGHPNVGIIAFYDANGARSRCTGTLVSPTVVVTAAHCTDGIVGQTAVKFDSLIADTPAQALAPAQDPSVGYTSAELTAQGWLSGQASTDPAYSHLTDKNNWNDVGVVVLDQPVTGVTPATIAPVGYLDQFTPNVLNSTLFTAVGYGVEMGQAPSGPQKPMPISYPIERRVADEPGQKLTDQLLQVNGNPNDPSGTGGTCFGDSGGPAFSGGYEVSVTSYTTAPDCQSIAGFQRLDLQGVQDWLATFGVTAGS